MLTAILTQPHTAPKTFAYKWLIVRRRGAYVHKIFFLYFILTLTSVIHIILSFLLFYYICVNLCNHSTEQSGHYVLAWKHGIAVLTAGDVKVTSNQRIRLMPPQGVVDTKANSYNLEIQNVRTTDAGDYACQMGSIIPKEIVHSLEVLGMWITFELEKNSIYEISISVPPKIDYVAPSTRIDVSKGASIKLECRATGNPPPTIFWSRKVSYRNVNV